MADYRDKFRRQRPLTPRMKMAIRLYETAAVATKKEAAKAVGMNPATFYVATSAGVADSQVAKMTQRISQMLEDESIDTSVLLEKLSRRALGVVNHLMEDAVKEDVRLRAAQDLLDRGPQTSKVQKHQVESFTLSGRDAKAIAEAMVQSASKRDEFAHLESEDYVRVGGTNDEEVRQRLEGIIGKEGQAAQEGP